MNEEWYNYWLEWFHQEADFGPADDDVRHMPMSAYEEETGKDCPAREE